MKEFKYCRVPLVSQERALVRRLLFLLQRAKILLAYAFFETHDAHGVLVPSSSTRNLSVLTCQSFGSSARAPIDGVQTMVAYVALAAVTAGY